MAPPAGKSKKFFSLCVPLMNKCSASSTGARVEIFVATPTCKIHFPIMQVQWHIAGGMSKSNKIGMVVSAPLARAVIHYEVLIDGNKVELPTDSLLKRIKV